jgi:flagellar basal-body rod protein FlgC
MELVNSLHIAAAGMKAQSDRLRVVSENIANAESTGNTPGAEPYRRKIISFEDHLNRELGIETVKARKPEYDKSDFKKEYNPSHPAADENGYVLMPNINSMIEMMDMREARRAYEANLNVVEASKSMLMQTINLLRN